MQNKVIIKEKNMYDLKRRMKFKEDIGYVLVGQVKNGYDGMYSCMMVKEIKR